MHSVYNLPRNERSHVWSDIIQAWRNSGLTQGKYCEQEQLKLMDFKRWRKRLLKLSKQTPPTASCEHTSLSFVPLQLQTCQATIEKKQNSIDLYVTERYRLSCSSPLDETLLAAVLSVLRGLSC